MSALRVAERLAADGIEASVLDLRSLAPLDREALLAVARHCNRVLIVHEDSRTGGIGESLAAIIQEEAFESLDAPVRIIGALDTPVPYSPPLEEFFLPSEAEIERAAGCFSLTDRISTPTPDCDRSEGTRFESTRVTDRTTAAAMSCPRKDGGREEGSGRFGN